MACSIDLARAFIRSPTASEPSHSAPYVDQAEAEKSKGYWRTQQESKWT